jgi:DNA repair protein RadC
MELMNNVGIKDLPPMERPREKLRHLGTGALTDMELLAVMLGSGTRKLSVLGVCRKLMDALDDDLGKLTELDVKALRSMTGIGEVRAVTFLAVVALAKRLQLLSAEKAATRLDDEALETLLRPAFEKSGGRLFLMVLLTVDRGLLATAELGAPDDGFPEISDMIKLAADAGAHKFILALNRLQAEVNGLGEYEKTYIREVCAAAEMMSLDFVGFTIFAGKAFYRFSIDQCKGFTTYGE